MQRGYQERDTIDEHVCAQRRARRDREHHPTFHSPPIYRVIRNKTVGGRVHGRIDLETAPRCPGAPVSEPLLGWCKCALVESPARTASPSSASRAMSTIPPG